MNTTLAKPRLITAKEFESSNQEWRYDLIEGVLHPMPLMAGFEHGDITNKFSIHAGVFVMNQRLGKCFAAETLIHYPA
jgi:hypothetical protein